MVRRMETRGYLFGLLVLVLSGCTLDGNGGDPWLILRQFSIGETGPAGGIVFYDKGERSDGWRYLEAWVEDIEASVSWANYDFVGTTATAIGAGKENTRTIVEFYTGTGIAEAADAATNFEVAGYNDWFLPSLDELQEMYTQQAVLPALQDVFYWSSTEIDTDNVQTINLTSGQNPPTDKLDLNSVRPIRMF
jgi:hypothetical protein